MGRYQSSEQLDEGLLSLRKSPSQARARTLVASILEATVRLLSRAPDSVSTREIAEKAGVSVGSLYEYYPTREAIFAHLVELDLERNERRLRAFVATLEGHSADSKIRAIVDFGVDQFLSGEAFKRILFKKVHRLRKVRDVLDAWNGIAAIFADLMREHPSEIRVPKEDIDLAAYVIGNASHGLLQTYLMSDGDRPTREQIKAEIIRLASGYLLRPEAASRG